MCLTEKKKLLGSNLRADNGAGSIANCHLQTLYTIETRLTVLPYQQENQ